MSMKRWLVWVGSAAAASVLSVSPTLAQTSEGLTELLSYEAGASSWTRAVVTLGSVGAAPSAIPVAGVFDPSGVAEPARVRSSISPVQTQESAGFPWLEVGIGAGVAALFISAVLTANSGDSAALPTGGVQVVLPGS
jgi:hypothetical protein